jgi:hypothetical protein
MVAPKIGLATPFAALDIHELDATGVPLDAAPDVVPESRGRSALGAAANCNDRGRMWRAATTPLRVMLLALDAVFAIRPLGAVVC